MIEVIIMQDYNFRMLTDKINDFIKLMTARDYAIIDVRYQMASYPFEHHIEQNHSALIMYEKKEPPFEPIIPDIIPRTYSVSGDSHLKQDTSNQAYPQD